MLSYCMMWPGLCREADPAHAGALSTASLPRSSISPQTAIPQACSVCFWQASRLSLPCVCVACAVVCVRLTGSRVSSQHA
eukprot:3940838-Rhodomonas_salina.5